MKPYSALIMAIQTFYLDAVGDTSMDTLLREWLPLVIVCILPLLCMVGAILFLPIQLIIRAAAPPNPKPIGGRVIVRQMSHANLSANQLRAQPTAAQGEKLRKHERLTADLKNAYGNAGRGTSNKNALRA